MLSSPTLQENPVLLLPAILILLLYYLLRSFICRLAGISTQNTEKAYRTMPAGQRSSGRLPGLLLLLQAISLPLNALPVLVSVPPLSPIPELTLLCTIATELALLRQRRLSKLTMQAMYTRIGAYLYHSGKGNILMPYPFELAAIRYLSPLLAAAALLLSATTP